MCKRCSSCRVDKPLAEFRKRRDTPDGLQYTCKACMRASQRKPETSARRRNRRLKRSYGITQDDYETMFHAQDGKCAICREPPPQGKNLHIDHDHGTSHVRQLLCTNCNTGLGKFKDSRQLLLAAVDYLDGNIHW